MVTTTAKTLEERVKALEDQQEIYRTLNQYSRTLDYGTDPAAWLDCFTEDGVWHTQAAGRWSGTGGVRAEGHKQLAEWYMKSGRDKPEWATTHLLTKHCWVVPDVAVDGDTASFDAYFFVPREGQQGPFFHSFGRYFVSLVRCEDGRWRIKDMDLRREAGDQVSQTRPVG
jgi:hypothetical protein